MSTSVIRYAGILALAAVSLPPLMGQGLRNGDKVYLLIPLTIMEYKPSNAFNVGRWSTEVSANGSVSGFEDWKLRGFPLWRV